MTDLSKMADGPDKGQAFLGRKVTKLLELEGFRWHTTRTGRTSKIWTCPRANSVADFYATLLLATAEYPTSMPFSLWVLLNCIGPLKMHKLSWVSQSGY